MEQKIFSNDPSRSPAFASNNVADPAQLYQNITTTVKLKGKDVRVHALCTGTVAIKTAFRTKKAPGELAKLAILFDKHYTEYLPIWVWVIEHPEGLMVIDTGETAAITDREKYLSKENAFMRFQARHVAKFKVSEKEALSYQFDRVGLKLGDVRLVALTHLHLDHTDGLKFFPKTEIIVGDYEFNHPVGNMPTTYPHWFNPNKVQYKANRIEVFDRAYSITASEDLMYVPTPGHTHGHSSVIFKTDDMDIIFAGDTSYQQQQVINGELAGVNADFRKSKETYRNLLAYASNRKTLYLPSHDENAGIRLRDRIFLG